MTGPTPNPRDLIGRVTSVSGARANLSLTAEAWLDLTGQSFAIGTTATGTLLPGNPLFNVSSAKLAVTGSIPNKTFNVAGSAQVRIWIRVMPPPCRAAAGRSRRFLPPSGRYLKSARRCGIRPAVDTRSA